tara:strand:+ start:467 stop:952 length:486 start_codon:yes stop_codon:yes gene_type:complete
MSLLEYGLNENGENYMKKILVAISLAFVSASSYAAEYTVNLVTVGTGNQSMVFEPGYLKISKGDTVVFAPSDITHNAVSFSIPPDAKSFSTPLDGKPAKVTFDTEGIYLYKCVPHAIMGMLGVIQVGKPVNLKQTKANWEKFKATVVVNKERVDEYLKNVK